VGTERENTPRSGDPALPADDPRATPQAFPQPHFPEQSPRTGGFPQTEGFSQQDPPVQGLPQQDPLTQGFPQQNPPAQGFPQQSPRAPGFPQQNPQAAGLPQAAFPEQSPPARGYPQPGFPERSPPTGGFPQQGFPDRAFPEPPARVPEASMPSVPPVPSPETPIRASEPPPVRSPEPGVRSSGPGASGPGMRESPSLGTPLGARETSGVQVRLGSRDSYDEPTPPRGPRRPDGRGRDGRGRGGRGDRGGWDQRGRGGRSGLIAAGLAAAAVAAIVTCAVVLLPGRDEQGVEAQTQTETATAAAALPPSGTPIEVATTDGSRYRLATVRGGTDDGAQGAQSPAPAGTSYAFIEYVLTNSGSQPSLLDFPGDVFLDRKLVVRSAQGRCVWQPGVPESMCTPPVRSTIVRRLGGGDLQNGDGGDRYLPPGSSFLVRAVVEVPVRERTKQSDLRLYVWKQLYMADQLAKEAPFPK
jgi:hypothetical protein